MLRAKKSMKKDLFPLLVLAVCFCAYGLLAPYLGFYWDDLPYMWFKHTNGTIGAVRAIALDRPLLGFFYLIPMSLLGESPLVWQIFAILCRWIFTLSVFRFLMDIFPKNRAANKLIILLFAIFPGFTQQYIAVIYSHAFLIFALYFFSLHLFIRAVGQERFSWLGLISILIALICMAATEYLVGLEVLRPLIIFLMISRKNQALTFKRKALKTLQIWLPYLAAGLGFVFYRTFLASSVLYKVQQVDNFFLSPLSTLVNLLTVTAHNIYTAVISAWVQIVHPLSSLDLSSLASKLYFTILMFVFIVSTIWIHHFQKRGESASLLSLDREYVISLAIGSVFILVFAGLPFWAANLKLDTNFPDDRFFLPFMLASVAVVFLVLAPTIQRKWLFAPLFSTIFALSLSYQVYQANIYRLDWERFIDLMSQITWRAPSMEKNTILVTNNLNLKYYSDNSLTAALNWIYAGSTKQGDLPYLINYTEAPRKSLPPLLPGKAITHNYRTLTFHGSTDQMIIFYQWPPGCLHFTDPELDPFNTLIDVSIRSATALSKPDLIHSAYQQNPAIFVKPQDENAWCFYYQKAALAAWEQDWQSAAAFGDLAFSLNDYPNDASERFPFIEGYAMTGNWRRALELTEETLRVSDLYQPMLCRLWERIASRQEAPLSIEEAMVEIETRLQCGWK